MKHFVFVLVTVCLVACGNKASKEVKKTAAPSGTVALSVSATIGVVNSDSILEKYTFAIQAQKKPKTHVCRSIQKPNSCKKSLPIFRTR